VRGVESNTTARTRYGRSFRRSGSKSLTLTLTLTLSWFFPLRRRLPLAVWESAILSTSRSVVRSIWIDAGPNNTALAVTGASEPPTRSQFGVSTFSPQAVAVCKCC